MYGGGFSQPGQVWQCCAAVWQVQPVWNLQRSGINILCQQPPAQTLSPMTSTQSQGKNPTSKPRFPLHQIDSSAPGMSITEIMSPTWTDEALVDH